MNYIERFIESIRFSMDTPKPYEAFHLISLLITAVLIVIISLNRKNKSELKLRLVLGIYGFSCLILEILKQLLFSSTYDPNSNILTWDFKWYSFPFQFCTTPMYAACIACFLKECKLRRALISYISFFTILGGIMVMLLPSDVYTRIVISNIHTTVLHAGGIVVSLFLIITGYVRLEKKSLLRGLFVYLTCVAVAQTLNVTLYKSGVLNGQTLDLFFISPYFKTSMPVFNLIDQVVDSVLYVILYVLAFLLGSSIVYGISRIVKSIRNRQKESKLLSV